MAQIRSKQIREFLSTVDWNDVSNVEIANAADIKQYVDGSQLAANTSINTRVSDLEDDLAAEISATNADVTSIDTRISNEEVRLDTVLELVNYGGENIDQFVEVVSIINAVDLENDNALAAVISDLNVEISATNVDVTSINTRITNDETALANAKSSLELIDGSLETRISLDEDALAAEIERATSEEARIEAALVAEIAATDSDVNSIDLRLGEVSGDLVESVDSLEVALSAEISATNGDVDSLETALSDHAAANVVTFGSVDTRISNEEVRLDTVLELVNYGGENIDQFIEVVSIINAVDTENDAALANVISDLNVEISSTNADVTSINTRISTDEAALAAEILRAQNAETSLGTALADHAAANVEQFNSVDTRFDGLDSALSAEISATNGDVDSLETALADHAAANVVTFGSVDTRFDGLDSALEDEISATNADFLSADGRMTTIEGNLSTEIATTNGEVTALQASVDSLEVVDAGLAGRIATLEGTIQEDNQQAIDKFSAASGNPANGLVYTLANAVQDDLTAMVNAYVNGHRVEVANVAGPQVELADPGYAIDGDDTVLFVYQY